MQINGDPSITIVQNLHLIQQAWTTLLARINQLKTVMLQIKSVYDPIEAILSKFHFDYYEEEFGLAHEILIWDVDELNRMIVGRNPEGSRLAYQYPALFQPTHPHNYYWYPNETDMHQDHFLIVYDRVVEHLLQSAFIYLKRCQRVHRGIKTMQRRFRDRYYAPGGPGARRAQTEFDSHRRDCNRVNPDHEHANRGYHRDPDELQPDSTGLDGPLHPDAST
jgi:hypothetical protein